jgi:sortase A
MNGIQLHIEQESDMDANVTDVIAEAAGSEEFREILFVLVQEKQESGFSAARRNTKLEPKVRIWIERILLVSGFTLLVVYCAARLESHLGSRAALRRFAEDTAPSDSVSNKGVEQTRPSEADFSLWDMHRLRAYKKDFKSAASPLAVLHISKIGLEAPLLEGTDALTLNRGVGRVPGTARPGEPGNIGIAGHRDGFFRGLKDIGIGDSIDLTTSSGKDHYVVDEIEIVKPNDTHVLEPRPVSSLTLVTCYPFYFIGSSPQRYIVHASRTEFEPTQSNPTEQGSLILANGNKEKTQ